MKSLYDTRFNGAAQFVWFVTVTDIEVVLAGTAVGVINTPAATAAANSAIDEISPVSVTLPFMIAASNSAGVSVQGAVEVGMMMTVGCTVSAALAELFAAFW